MAGQTPLFIEASGRNHSVPDHFQDVVVILNTATTPVDTSDTIIFYAERETVVDKVVFWSGTGSDTDQSFQLKRIASAQDPDGAGTAFTTALSITAANTPFSATLTAVSGIPTENIIPAGSMIAVNIEGTGSAMDVGIQLRIRTRVTG